MTLMRSNRGKPVDWIVLEGWAEELRMDMREHDADPIQAKDEDLDKWADRFGLDRKDFRTAYWSSTKG